MFNLIKADLYRLFKTKSYYIVGVILSLLPLMIMYSLGEQINVGAGNQLGFNFLQPNITDLVYNVLFNTLILLLVGIEAAVYICADFSSGYIKNVASSVNRKSMIAISKFVAFAIGAVFYFVAIVISVYIFGSIFIGNVQLQNLTGLLGYVGMAYFLTMVVTGFVVLVTNLFRNSAASITTLVLVILLASMLYMAINQFLGVDLTNISPIMNYENLVPNDTGKWLEMILSGLGFLGVYVIGSSILIEKKDIT